MHIHIYRFKNNRSPRAHGHFPSSFSRPRHVHVVEKKEIRKVEKSKEKEKNKNLKRNRKKFKKKRCVHVVGFPGKPFSPGCSRRLV